MSSEDLLIYVLIEIGTYLTMSHIHNVSQNRGTVDLGL